MGVPVTSPKMENIQKSLALVTEAEKEWRAAWSGQVPTMGSSVTEINSALSTARQLLQALVSR